MKRYDYCSWIVWVAVLFCATPLLGQDAANAKIATPVAGWPPQVQSIKYLSSADNSLQPALLYDPGGDEPKPLLIALHSWSGDYTQANPAYALWCISKGWVMMHPNFRGINQRPEACGSELAVKDIISAVEHCKKHSKIDASRVYLIGASGGGYASLLMAGRAPDLWAGVSAWCPIYDLKAWHAEAKANQPRYATMMEKVCGGAPGVSSEVDEQYRVRSAAAWLEHAQGVNLAINTGITDGHNGSVPVGHTLRAFNAVAAPADRIVESNIKLMEQKPEMPASLLQSSDDPLFTTKPVLFRRVSRTARVTIFQGGHEIIYPAGLAWLEQQRKGQPPVWDVRDVPTVDLTKIDTASGK